MRRLSKSAEKDQQVREERAKRLKATRDFDSKENLRTLNEPAETDWKTREEGANRSKETGEFKRQQNCFLANQLRRTRKFEKKEQRAYKRLESMTAREI